MSAMTRYQRERTDHGTVTVSITAGHVAQDDRVKSVEFYGAMSAMEAHALLTKTLNVATRAASEVHEGYTVSVTLHKRRPDDMPF